jgi:O-antigen ligase
LGVCNPGSSALYVGARTVGWFHPLAVFQWDVGGRLRGTFNPKQDIAAAYDLARAREQLFWRSVDITKQHPFFGVRPGNFDIVSGQWHTTYNSMTLMSSEGGVPALVLYILILWRGFKNLRAAKRLARGQSQSALLARTLASLWGYAVGSLFLSVANEFFLYILVAYTTTLLSTARKSAAERRKSERLQKEIAERRVSGGIAESGIIPLPCEEGSLGTSYPPESLR